MRVNEDIDGWVVIGSEPGLRELAFQLVTEWSRRAGLIRRITSNCISTSAWMTRIKPGRSSGRLAPLVRQVSLRQGSGSSSTPSGIHSASSSVATAQAEPSPAHAVLGEGAKGGV